ncbi:hypothetical protein [Acidiferrobacter thiooxydans]|uniref:hypothetical protein n=1 Tax=Acidiferrobacter thiooxydans TaxID=163359 RepID=UPI0011C073C0|nr:hypothetical protein [Acidiferrobacter thiooxydans]
MAALMEGTLDWFFETVAIRDLGKMIDQAELHYLSFGIMGPIIELLGSVYDTKSFLTTENVWNGRFNAALARIPSLRRYQRNRVGKQHDLYKHMRHGMAHVGAPETGVVFTQRSDPYDGHRHLNKDSYNGTRRLILVCEDLHADIVDAIPYVRGDRSRKKDLDMAFMNPRLLPDSAPVPTLTCSVSG